MSTIMKFMAKLKPFHEYIFDSTILNETEPITLVEITNYWE